MEQDENRRRQSRAEQVSPRAGRPHRKRRFHPGNRLLPLPLLRTAATRPEQLPAPTPPHFTQSGNQTGRGRGTELTVLAPPPFLRRLRGKRQIYRVGLPALNAIFHLTRACAQTALFPKPEGPGVRNPRAKSPALTQSAFRKPRGRAAGIYNKSLSRSTRFVRIRRSAIGVLCEALSVWAIPVHPSVGASCAEPTPKSRPLKPPPVLYDRQQPARFHTLVQQIRKQFLFLVNCPFRFQRGLDNVDLPRLSSLLPAFIKRGKS